MEREDSSPGENGLHEHEKTKTLGLPTPSGFKVGGAKSTREREKTAANRFATIIASVFSLRRSKSPESKEKKGADIFSGEYTLPLTDTTVATERRENLKIIAAAKSNVYSEAALVDCYATYGVAYGDFNPLEVDPEDKLSIIYSDIGSMDVDSNTHMEASTSIAYHSGECMDSEKKLTEEN